MITIPFILDSAITGNRTVKGTIVIDNIGGTKARRDYRVRAYAKGAERAGLRSMLRTAKPFREAQVIGHNSDGEPVWALVAKALAALGYA